MKKIKIGIPRALLYYRYGVLWKNFFETLGCNVVLSPETNREILEIGINNTIDECCLSYKIYIGHVLYLRDICDYILVTRVCDYGRKDKVCTRLNGTYDDIKKSPTWGFYFATITIAVRRTVSSNIYPVCISSTIVFDACSGDSIT